MLRNRAARIIACVAASAATPVFADVEAQVIDLRELRLPRWTAQPVFRLGSADGQYDAFVSPGVPQFDKVGNIYVLDSRLPALRVFDPRGRFLRQIGQRGDGPGEYRNPAAFGFLGDTVWIADSRDGRISFYRNDGRIITTFRLGGDDAPPVVPVRILGPDEFLVIVPPGPDLRNTTVGPLTFTQSMVRTNRTGSRQDTMVTYVADAPGIVTAPGGRGVFGYQPILDGPIVSYLADRDLVREIHRRAPQSRVGEFQIQFRSRNGPVVQQRTFRYASLSLPRNVRDSLMSEARRRLTGRAVATRPIVEKHLYLPDFQPPVTSFAMAPDGGYWLRREEFPRGAHEYLILDSRLMPVAILEQPRAVIRILSVGHDDFWALEKDAFDVPYLVRYAIRRQ
jgi:hypothetical protein